MFRKAHRQTNLIISTQRKRVPHYIILYDCPFFTCLYNSTMSAKKDAKIATVKKWEKQHGGNFYGKKT